ncbi:DJ-1/PfpI family protein [uncultured Cohaesibacter sp.]|uniref:DJ-1/PfpI family protein n=1 Tax=uncultured Cohaesibacter sp. TaxID=1002546 RepID=UPI00292EC233|nr:DJ-1/PfpI family protein [uncultured Cohaesibacter sp.]
MTRRIGILLYENVEVLDFSGPFEVFTTAVRVAEKLGESFVYQPVLIASSSEPVVARAGYRVLPDHDFATHPALDCLLVPGGVHEPQLENGPLLDWIRKQASDLSLLGSVCTGAFLLAEAGLIDGKTVTTHWEDIPDFKKRYPAIHVHERVRWVEDGALVTSAGISAGIDMALYMVERLHSRALAEQTAGQMEFDWTRSGYQTA